VKHLCIRCGYLHPIGFHPFCDRCGGLVDVEYDLERVSLVDSDNPFIRFAGLLPFEGAHDRLPAVGYTPLIHATRVGRKAGMDSLFFKNETTLPTRTTKFRMAAVALPYLHDRGVRSFSASSTGNSSTALAYCIARFADMHLYLFSGEQFVPRVAFAEHAQVTHFGLRRASFVEAGEYANRYAARHGLTAEGGFFNPGRREGLKLAFLEASDQAPRPIEWYVQAVSSAMGVYGTYKGAKELLRLGLIKQLPRLLCVQQESCAPMVHAFAEGSLEIRAEHRVANPAGIAEAILRGDPTRAFPYVRSIVMDSRGGFVAVDETEIRQTRRMVEEEEGICLCFSAAAAVAGVMKRAARDPALAHAMVVVNLTGSDRPEQPPSPRVDWIDRTGDGWNARPPAMRDTH
jgi:threonine synthase